MDMGNGFDIKTSDFIGLCYIIDEYSMFNNDIKDIMQYTDKVSFVNTLNQLQESSHVFFNKKIKDFYAAYKPYLYQLEKHVKFPDFFMENYDYNGLPKPELEEAHNYLMRNRSKTNNILDVLYSIKNLDIDKIGVNEKNNFTLAPYELHKEFARNRFLFYVLNPRAISTYENNIIKIVTDNSPYEIRVKTIDGSVDRENRIIRCNTLLFDPFDLPRRLDREILFDDMMSMGEQAAKYNGLVREYVDLTISLDHLLLQYERTNILLGHYESFKNREDVIRALESIKKAVEYLSHLTNIYVDQTHMTKKQLDEEKNLHLSKMNKK